MNTFINSLFLKNIKIFRIVDFNEDDVKIKNLNYEKSKIKEA